MTTLSAESVNCMQSAETQILIQFNSIQFNSVLFQKLLSLQLYDVSRLKVGKNLMINRLSTLNGQIKFDWLNLGLNSFKIKMKELFMT